MDLNLQHEATTKLLLEYIQTKNGWSERIGVLINWEAHGTALKQSTVPHTHLVKVLHDILPTTTAQANKFDGGKRQCHLCDTVFEDRDHIIKCPHASRQEWRESFMTGLGRFHREHYTRPDLRRLLDDSVQSWFQSSESIRINPSQYPDTLRHLISQQNRRFGIAWSTHQSQHLGQHPQTPGTKLVENETSSLTRKHE
jgi:hypothetical protein